MKSPLNLMLVSAMAIFFFGFSSIVTPSSAQASWGDNSDNLPGMHKFPTELVILTGVVVVGAIVYMVAKKNKSDKNLPTENSTKGKTEESSGATTDSTQTSTIEPAATSSLLDIESNQSGSKLGLYFDVDSPDQVSPLRSSKPRLSDLTFKVGFSIGF